jgi:hypothetical protein
VLVLIVWAGAIALFFNRWGKIRMLLPYQPDYKEQLKVPGTGVCAAANAAYTQHPTQHACSQVTHRYTASAMRSLGDLNPSLDLNRCQPASAPERQTEVASSAQAEFAIPASQ